MEISIYSSETELLELENEWTKLIDKLEVFSPFLTWEWINQWWTSYKPKLAQGSELFIICARDNKNGLFCIIPLFKTQISSPIGKLNTLKVLGTEFESSDYLDIILSKEYTKDVVLNIFNDLKVKNVLKDIDKIILNNLLTDSLLWQLKTEFKQKYKYTTFTKKTSICPYLNLPDNKEELLKLFSKNMKSGLRRNRNKINKETNLTIHKIEKASEIDESIKALFDLHDQRFSDQDKDTKFLFNQRGAFHQNIAKTFLSKGWLAFYLARFSKQVVGALYCFVFNNRMMYLQAGFDPEYSKYGLGNQLIFKAVTDSIDSKYNEFDFMRGNEEYKKKWTSETRILYQLEFGLSLKGKCDTHFDQVVFSTKNFIKKILNKS
jgi:CelD/BcsL family acetyltransferase involved in cellulose biosynthesis